MSDELRDRLARIDPVRDIPVLDGSSPMLDDLLEDIMTTQITDIPAPDGPEDRDRQAGPRSRPGRRLALAVAGVAACAALAVGLAVSLDGGDDPGEQLALAAAPGDAMASCLPVSADVMAQMPVAFAATATAVEGESVTLTVDRWYTAGAADAVVVTQASETSMALIGGVQFVEGGAYLITATDGVVNACGFSGEASPELLAIFEEAFGA
ncbi:MAG: hypothetical protein RIE08_01700 [Acidimicrobiales bacterium]